MQEKFREEEEEEEDLTDNEIENAQSAG